MPEEKSKLRIFIGRAAGWISAGFASLWFEVLP
jgi:hypothetical protein